MEDKFLAAINFLKTYDWIHDFKVIEFFSKEQWKLIPNQWADVITNLSTESLNTVPDGYIEDSWPPSLIEFIKTSVELGTNKNSSSVTVEALNLDPELCRGMSEKKKHEVSHLAAFVDQMLKKWKEMRVVDCGCGLGYLDQILSKQMGYEVLGLESKETLAHKSSEKSNSGKELNCKELHIHNNKSVNGTYHGEIYTANKDKCLQNSETKPVCNSSNICSQSNKFTAVAFELRDSEDSYIELEHLINNHWSDSDHIKKSDQELETSQCTCNSELSVKRNCLKKSFESVTRSSENIVTSKVCGCEKLSKEPKISCHAHKSSDSCVKNNCEEINAESVTHSSESILASKDCESESVVTSRKAEENLSPRVCLVGLHCCGDLTPVVLHSFVRLKSSAGVVCLSCCYHKMSTVSGAAKEKERSDDKADFNQFPMSSVLAKVLDHHNSYRLSVYSLRLAAQETRTRWRAQTAEMHESHMKHVAYRSLLELACQELGIDFLRCGRNVVKRKSYSNFNSFVQNAILNQPDGECLAQMLHSLHSRYEEFFKYIEPFTMLQVMLQPVLEQLILTDRLEYLKEQGFHQSYLMPLFKDELSPRNFAIVAEK